MGRTKVGVKSGHSQKAASKRKGQLQKQTKDLRSAKMAAVRQIVNQVTHGGLAFDKKFLDTYKTETAVACVAALTGGEYDPTGGCTNAISVPAQDDTASGRDGKHYTIESVILKGYVKVDGSVGAAVTDPIDVFVAVVLDTQTNGAQMNSEDCFKNTANVTTTASTPLKNLLSGKRFRILKSQNFTVTPLGVSGPSATLAYNATRRDIDWYIPLKGGLQVNCNGSANADVAACTDNSIHVIAFASLAGAKLAYNARVRFTG